VFVLLGGVAAFWPPDFFNNNLANLDQLNFWFPFIMLVFIPTITMGIWADERKQGTDELLLTIPADDFDIVLGKYLAALAIYSVALLFSMFCNYAVLRWLGQPDTGLFVGTYVGYWLIGAAMLAIGMVASFLTSNVTIGFILGVLFNIPLVFLIAADVLFGTFGQQFVQMVKQWSIGDQFSDFGHGVLSLAGWTYYLMILVVMLYVSMVLIGRRHWFSGEHRWAHAIHYTMRSAALVVITGGVVVFFQHRDFRYDVTSEKLSSLSQNTTDLIRDLKTTRQVQIDAFVSPTVPESYVQTRMNLLTVLRELQALGGKNVQVRIHNTERYSEEAALAEKRFGIEPHQVSTFSHGKGAVESIFLNVAMSCGVQKVPPVFIDRGIPVEYELVRSICTVSEQKRKRVGVVKTDVELFGGFNMQAMSATPSWPMIDELEKQYEVIKVDPTKPITEKFDVLLAVQPSSLGSAEMDNFVAAVERGQPTAIFEDPAPVFGAGVPATSMPRQAPGGGNPMFGGQPPPPKGDISKLWQLLGIEFIPDQVIWQDYNPYPKASHFPREFVFVDNSCGARKPFDEQDEITSGLQHILFPFPGAVAKLNTSSLGFTRLVQTGEKTGTVAFQEIMQMGPFGPRGGLNPNRRQTSTASTYVLAAHIQGKVPLPPSGPDAEKKGGKDEKGGKDAAAKPGESNVNVVVVADIDMLSQDFFRLREQGDMPEMGMHFDFDNVTFVLNVLDDLAGDHRFVEIRKRRPKHRTLTRIEERTRTSKEDAAASREKFIKTYDDAEQQEQKQISDKIAELKQRKSVDIQQMAIEVAMMQQDLEQRKAVRLGQMQRQKDAEINRVETSLALEIRKVQDQYKLWAVLLPPIPPLLVAIVVFITRRRREREGVSRARLR
jgi:ABC-2 type transport system permease protein